MAGVAYFAITLKHRQYILRREGDGGVGSGLCKVWRVKV